MRTARFPSSGEGGRCPAPPLDAGCRPPPPWMQTPPPVMWPVMHAGKPTPTPLWKIDTCENITLPQTSFVCGNYIDLQV